ncbi:MAG: flagellar biosynthetic protein FliR [Alicyclobacillaceae bacterium]|nr:flagellar biosynthetic protein FliR [Alicyclobacillaceae bacterium]
MAQYAWSHYSLYLLVLLRMVAFVATSPLMSVRFWPAWAKLGLAAFAALSILPDVAAAPGANAVPDPSTEPGLFIVAAVHETVTGTLMGFVSTVTASAVSWAGQVLDLQVGFGAASFFDPAVNLGEGQISAVQSWLFTLCFLGMGGLDGLMLAALHSYQSVPVGHFHWPAGAWQWFAHLASLAMSICLQLALPVLAALLVVDVALALLSRAVPQTNAFAVGQPAKLTVGLGLLAVWVPGMVYVFGELFNQIFRQLDALLTVLGG